MSNIKYWFSADFGDSGQAWWVLVWGSRRKDRSSILEISERDVEYKILIVS